MCESRVIYSRYLTVKYISLRVIMNIDYWEMFQYEQILIAPTETSMTRNTLDTYLYVDIIIDYISVCMFIIYINLLFAVNIAIIVRR